MANVLDWNESEQENFHLLRHENSPEEQLWLNDHTTIRSYEVSVWTLQDDFITVLKHSELENKGQIQDPKMVLKTDGTQEFTFSIPMYLYNYKTNKLEENPIWYNTRNGNIAIDMRKIKVIFNKATEDEKIYEFLIIKINESHSKDILTCEVTCDGLAFHELGKIGYKISLKPEDFYADDLAWFKDNWNTPALNMYGEEDVERDNDGKPVYKSDGTYNTIYSYKYGDRNANESERKIAYEQAMPIANINYWLNKFLEELPSEGVPNPRKWYYSINMNYDAFENDIERLPRESSKIYEETYPAAWKVEDERLSVTRYEKYEEKQRLIDEEESNIYNLTQAIAETFEVFCRYEYTYDDNYHITGRRIIFYNNFIYEDEGYRDITYPYSTSEISREMDSSDLATKMFVKAVEDDTVATGLLTIIDTEANNSGEDYLLNFDYLHSIGTISEEQYAEVSNYEKNMKKVNLRLVPIESRIVALSSQLPTLKAKLQVASNAIQLDKERIGAANDLYNALTDGDGEIEITAMNPATAILLKEGGSEESASDSARDVPYYINITKRGVDANSIRIFRYFDVTKTKYFPSENDSDISYYDENNNHDSRLYGEILTGRAERDEFGDVTKVTNLFLDSSGRKTVFLVFNYSPKLYYDRVIETWTNRLDKDEKDKVLYEEKIDNINQKIKILNFQYNLLLKEKDRLIKAFEHMMGPALREGYWAPDDYKDCGDKYTDEIVLSCELNGDYDHRKKEEDSNLAGAGQNLSPKKELLNYFIWDEEPFEDEFNCVYEIGSEQQKKCYPYIDLSNYLDLFTAQEIEDGRYETPEEVKSRVNQLSFFFCDYNGLEGIKSGGVDDSGNLNNNSLTLYDKEAADPKAMRAFSVGSQCHYGFIKNNNIIVPALILDGMSTIPENVSVTRVWTETKMDNNDNPMLDEDGNEIKEVKQVTQTENMLNFIKSRKMKIGNVKVEIDNQGNKNLVFFNDMDIQPNDWHGILPSTTNRANGDNYVSVYPRMVIESLAVKTSSDQLHITFNKKLLTSVQDYYCLTKVPGYRLEEENLSLLTNVQGGNEQELIEQILNMPDDDIIRANYYITLKPEVILASGALQKFVDPESQVGASPTYGIMYVISNADTAIFLDAKKILKENAYPRVSYTVKLNLLDKQFLHTAYNRLRNIVHINDAELKFNNVMGYISEVSLNLNKPWEDEVEIKNYKTKFEDLFSTILASMSDMKKNSYVIRAASAALFPGGSLRPWAIEGTIYKADLDYAFNHGTLTIDEKNGIWGISDSGIVAIRGGGIFTSTEQDNQGNWKWNTGITPEGINATLITAGQLDTNRVMVYAGDKLRFQLNGEGLFAYKSFFEDLGTINEWLKNENNNQITTQRDVTINEINAKLNEDENSDLDAAQFVKMDANGLALIAKQNALVLNNEKNDYIKIGGRLFIWDDGSGNEIPTIVPPDGIERVSISWDGLTLRNYYNQKVFYADADTGNLNIKGTLFANEIKIGGEGEETSLSLNEYLGNPDALIIEGLTTENVETIMPNNQQSITVYYTTESDLINYLNSDNDIIEKNLSVNDTIEYQKRYKQGKDGDIWFNIRSPRKELTIFKINSVPRSGKKTVTFKKKQYNQLTHNFEEVDVTSEVDYTKYEHWKMVQLENNNSDYKIAKALLGIFQSNITGSKYNTIYKLGPWGIDASHPGQRHPAPIVEEVSRLVIIDNSTNPPKEYRPSTIQQTTWGQFQEAHSNLNNYLDTQDAYFRVDTETLTTEFPNDYEDIPLEEQKPNFSSIQNFNENDLRYGDIWINLGKDGNEQVGIYRWEPDYKLEEELLTHEGELLGNKNNNNSNNEDNDNNSNQEQQQQQENGKWVLIHGISNITATDSYLYDLTAAEGKVGRIAHGEYGLIFTDSKQITDIQLNKRVGLQIKSGIKRTSANDFAKYNNGAYFRVNSSQFGFVSEYKDNNGYSIPYLYYEDGNLFIMGTIFAKNFYVIDRPGGYKTDFDTYINCKFEDNVKISNNLSQIFDKAGEIISKASRSLHDIIDLNDENLGILTSFYENIKADVTPELIRGPAHMVKFKPGDVWEKTITGNNVEAVYLAMEYWDDVYATETEAQNGITSTKGWNKTYDNRLAQIKGARVEYDAVTGKVIIEGENSIDVASGGTLTLGGNDLVDIYSNQEVHIGGKKIYIGAASINGTSNTSGIYLVNSNVINKTTDVNGELTGTAIQMDANIDINANTISKVFITPEGIDMRATNGIRIASAVGINIKTSTIDSASVIDISKDKGVWLGSNQKISLFSGETLTNVDASNTIDSIRNGASIEISPTRILFGVSSVYNNTLANSTAIDMTKDYIVLASGGNISTIENPSNQQTNLPYTALKNEQISGVVITKDEIGLATISNNGNNRNLILMDSDGITLGNAQDAKRAAIIHNNTNNETINNITYYDYTGSFVKISNDGIRVGSTGHLYIRSSNVFLDDSIDLKTYSGGTNLYTGFGLGQMPNADGWSTWGTTNFDNWGMVFDGQNLHVKGYVYAKGITIRENNNTTDNGISWENYFKELFNTAAEIIGDIQSAAVNLGQENTRNHILFTTFQNTMRTRLQAKTYNNSRTITSGWDFKPGDYWIIPNDGTYLAMAYWYEVCTLEEKARLEAAASGSSTGDVASLLTSKKGWTKVNSDKVPNTLIGAAMYTDADAGVISMWANSGIHLFSDNRTTNNGTVQTTTGTSAIDITPAGIVLAATKKIELGVSNVSTDETTGTGTISGAFTGIRLSAADGLWLGSDKAIKLFASGVNSTSSANMTISPEEILFGVVSNNTAVVDITRTKIIMGVVDTQANQSAYLATGQPTITTNTNGIITNVSGTAGMRIMKDSFGLVTRSNNTDNVILLDESGIGIASKNNSNVYSGIIIRPSMLVMTTAGKVQLIGNSGAIVFGTDKNEPNFRVDEEGNIYCNSITCRNGMVSGSQQPTAINTNVTPYTTNQITIGTNIIQQNSSYIITKTVNNINYKVSQPGEYLLKVEYKKTGYTSHGYFQEASITINGSTYSSSFPFFQNEDTKIFTYPIYLNNISGTFSIYIKLDPEALSEFPALYATLTFYPNFKGGSTQNDMAAGWSNQTYTATDKNTNTVLGTTSILGDWDSSGTTRYYRVKADDINETEILSTYVTGSWDITNHKYKVYSENTNNLLLETANVSGTWSNKTYSNSTTGMSTTLSGTWNNGTYTVKADTNTNTGLSTTPSISVAKYNSTPNNNNIIKELTSNDTSDEYYYIGIETANSGKYIKLKKKAAVDNTKTIGNITGTQTKNINSCNNRLDNIEFNTYGYYSGNSTYSYNGTTNMSLVSLLISILNHSNFKINDATPKHITYASNRNTSSPNTNSMCIINCYGNTDSDVLATITLPFSIAESSSTGTIKERES